ncbi:MAG: N-acetylmuramic acid 6-phosphate etherase [Verrucomicrobia subdivision 3 bacterium]|nr:N-acetylmuramic acid 6-phosphate etherase [Limisphaerales bacterium]
MAKALKFQRPFTLGIEGGGTRTTALLADAHGREMERATFGPGNVRLLDDRALVKLLRGIGKQFEKPDAIGLGLAGARNETDRKRVRTAVAKVWRGMPCHVTHDLEIALAGRALRARRGGLGQPALPTVLVLSGTGSCCFGMAPDGRTAKMGGWGHVLGDKGSGFEIGLRGLKAVVFYFDRDGAWSRLGEKLLAATGCNAPDDLIDWVAIADKDAIAALAPEVFAAAKQRDRIARDVLVGAAGMLAKDAVACAGKLVKKNSPVEFVLSGGVLRNQPAFARNVAAEIKSRWPNANVSTQKRDGVWGAIVLGTALLKKTDSQTRPSKAQRSGQWRDEPASPQSPGHLPATEERNRRSMNLDKLPTQSAITLMLSEEALGARAVLGESKKIARIVGWVAAALKDGGRLFYVGAGTSGRLGVLDASECPPTFRARPEQVQGIIAGGPRALTRSIEGAEDDSDAGAAAVQFRGVGKKDVVIGLAASGRTPFVWGAMEAAAKRGARTALVCFDPKLKRRAGVPHLIVAPAIGPEVLTGSTRLKAGTATKLILNCITTLAMVRLGKVRGNLMVDLDPKNKKLRDRAVRIVQTLTGAEEGRARAALVQAGWDIRRLNFQ